MPVRENPETAFCIYIHRSDHRFYYDTYLEVKDLLTLYKGDSYLDILSTQIAAKEQAHIQIKGLVGSLDAVVAAAMQEKKKSPAVYVLSDREEAAYFQNDLQNLIGKTEVLFYPTSYKRPYHYEEVDNANVLMRGEILNKLSASKTLPTQIDLSGGFI